MRGLTSTGILAAVPEEKQGMVSTVLMFVDICESAEVDGVDVVTRRLLEQLGRRPLLELSKVKGYRHVYDNVPRWAGEVEGLAETKGDELPVDVDMRELFPMCFPGPQHTGVVRDQSVCGSCWAFASATAVMSTMCALGQGSGTVDADGNRREVSVQRILSCNKMDFGCEGGHALAAQSSFKEAKLAAEKTLPYKCYTEGMATEHFEKASDLCTDHPWGGDNSTCQASHAEASWSSEGLRLIIGEKEIMQLLAGGRALYVTMMVHMNFLLHDSPVVYTETTGDALGGHALVMVGYGVEKQGADQTPYWLLQNSWGPAWGDHGYIKVLRGRNLGQIEDTPLFFDAAVRLSDGSLAAGPPAQETKVGDVPDVPGLRKLVRLLGKAGLTPIVAEVALAALLFAVCCCCLRCCCSRGGGAYSSVKAMPNPEESRSTLVESESESDSDGAAGGGGICCCSSPSQAKQLAQAKRAVARAPVRQERPQQQRPAARKRGP